MKIQERHLEKQIESWMFQEKVIVLYGARQVGKTTLCKKLLKTHSGFFFNAELQTVKDLFEQKNIPHIIASLQGNNMGIIDEAQKIRGIGEVLKILIDEHPEIQWIATGSSSFDLANQTAEPLTGRKITFIMFPPSVSEFALSPLTLSQETSSLLVYGSYPAIALEPSFQKKQVLLSELASDYLYKDVLEFESLKKPELLIKLLKALALQLGSEVSVHELSKLLQTSSETITRYLSLLEKSFVIFSLTSFSRNLRKELTKKKKYFFYDIGIRNSLLQNFTPLESRSDIGALWENFCIIERMKYMQHQQRMNNSYFWRTHDQKEIDYIEEENGILRAFEIKWNTKKTPKLPKDFNNAYPENEFHIINPESFWDTVLQ